MTATAMKTLVTGDTLDLDVLPSVVICQVGEFAALSEKEI